MNLGITIGRKDVGFQYDKIKSLLRKFDQIEKHKNVLEQLSIQLELPKDEYHELSTGIIWRLARHYQNLPCRKYIGSTKEVAESLSRKGFWDDLTGTKRRKIMPDFIRVPIDLTSFAPIRQKTARAKTQEAESIFKNAMLSTIDEANEFHGEVSHNILEILTNAFDHSEHASEAGIICTMNESSGIINACVVDMGQGIRKSLLTNPNIRSEYIGAEEHDLLKRVTQYRVSCNPNDSPHPNYPLAGNAGMGLYYASLLSRKHRDGKLIVISGKGYYYTDYEGREIIRSLGDVTWPGTIVFFQVNLKQKLCSEYRDIVFGRQ